MTRTFFGSVDGIVNTFLRHKLLFDKSELKAVASLFMLERTKL